MDTYTTFWGDTHHNTYQHYMQDPPLTDVLAFASRHLDFYCGAYYTQVFEAVPPLSHVAQAVADLAGGHPEEKLARMGQRWTGIRLEVPKDPVKLAQEWDEFQQITAAWNRPGNFIAFPGYEWQGNGRWGDFNVTYKQEGPPVHMVATLPELYAKLRAQQATHQSIAIPHHTAYLTGQRAPDWATVDETFSPYAELYSIHGCSETDEEWVGLRNNAHMGPGVSGGTYQDALNRGLHMGAICSTDNWANMPAHWNQGIMACLARELTRDSLWDAFRARRVYGATGDRIQLDFTCNGAAMGSILPHTTARELHVSVRGCDAIDRIEVLRNGRVIATHNHQGTWDVPENGTKSRFKLRIEPGWGPQIGEVPLADQRWDGELTVHDGRVIGWEPCWVTRGQAVPQIANDSAHFTMISTQEYANKEMQGATVFELEAAPDAEITLRLNGMDVRDTVRAFATRSRILWYRDQAIDLVRETTGVEPERADPTDVYYHLAPKAKLHRAIPEAGYTATFSLVDDTPIERETRYRVRVEQRNGQRAWSSPIWVKSL